MTGTGTETGPGPETFSGDIREGRRSCRGKWGGGFGDGQEGEDGEKEY